jgi:competence protein ComEC
MFYYAGEISALPNSYFYVPSFTNLGIGLIAIGGLVLAFLSTRLRLAGIIPIILGLMTIYDYKKPDIILDGGGKIFAIQNEKNELVVSSKSKARFTRDVWMQSSGQETIQTLQDYGNESCNKSVCFYEKDGRTALILSDVSEPQKFCDKIDFFINLSEKSFTCDKSRFNITRGDLHRNGAHVLRLSLEKPMETVSDYRADRVWNRGKRNG